MIVQGHKRNAEMCGRKTLERAGCCKDYFWLNNSISRVRFDTKYLQEFFQTNLLPIAIVKCSNKSFLPSLLPCNKCVLGFFAELLNSSRMDDFI